MNVKLYSMPIIWLSDNTTSTATTNSSKGFASILEKIQSAHTRSIQSESEPINELSKIEVESEYKGPHVQLPLTLDNTKELLDYFKGKKVCLYSLLFRLIVDLNLSLSLFCFFIIFGIYFTIRFSISVDILKSIISYCRL